MIEAISNSSLDVTSKNPKILTNIKINDPRWHHSEGWVKSSYNSNGIKIHYVIQCENGIVKAVDDFKFKS